MPFACADFERVGHLDAEIEKLLDLHRVPGDLRREGFAFDELHHDEGLPLVLLDGVHGADAGVVQGRRRARLALEPLEHRRVLRELRGEELQGDVRGRSRVSSASYTTPMPPAPSWRTIR